MNVGVAYADKFKKVWLKLEVPDDSSVREAIEHSGLLTQFPEIDLDIQKVGIFGRLTKLTAKIAEHDRVEIYRDITADPENVERRDSEATRNLPDPGQPLTAPRPGPAVRVCGQGALHGPSHPHQIR